MKTILKFESEGCSQCRYLSLTLMEVEKATKKGEVEIKPIDVEDESNQELVDKYKVRGLPTLIFLDENNEEYEKMVGNRPFGDIMKALGAKD